jgi:hypothetical protein
VSNLLDDLGYEPEWSEEQKQHFEKLDYLIHKIFAQTDEGKELLEYWKRALTLSPTAEPGYDLLDIGLAEGKKTFIRNILLTIDKVEST